MSIAATCAGSFTSGSASNDTLAGCATASFAVSASLNPATTCSAWRLDSTMNALDELELLELDDDELFPEPPPPDTVSPTCDATDKIVPSAGATSCVSESVLLALSTAVCAFSTATK